MTILKIFALIGSFVVWKVISLKALSDSVSEFDWYLADR